MPQTQLPSDLIALRVVHLPGGLRAFEFGEAETEVGPVFGRPVFTIPRQPYNALYDAVTGLGLPPIGADFCSRGTDLLADHVAPDFQLYTPGLGFAALWAERAWSNVRNIPEQRTPDVIDISARFRTYLRLLPQRVRELSEAYRRCLLAQTTDFNGNCESPKHGELFSNGFQVHIEAAIHSFLADATSLRDLIAEAIWRLVLREPSNDVNTIRSLLKRTQKYPSPPPLLLEVKIGAAEGGWIGNLSALRNSVTHVAPIANTYEMHMTQMRLLRIGTGRTPTVHYPLTTAKGTLRERPAPIDFDGDEAGITARFEEYAAFVETSGDALAYAVDMLRKLVSLADRVRDSAGLRHQIRTITDKDIVGPIVFRGGQA